MHVYRDISSAVSRKLCNSATCRKRQREKKKLIPPLVISIVEGASCQLHISPKRTSTDRVHFGFSEEKRTASKQITDKKRKKKEKGVYVYVRRSGGNGVHKHKEEETRNVRLPFAKDSTFVYDTHTHSHVHYASKNWNK